MKQQNLEELSTMRIVHRKLYVPSTNTKSLSNYDDKRYFIKVIEKEP